MKRADRAATPAGIVVVITALAAGLAGCEAGSAWTPSPAPTTVTFVPATPTASVAGREAPPDASLAAEGGDPVVGQLGTYTWFDGGSDAPWLSGTPIALGAGERLTVRLEPAVEIAAWDARYVAGAADGPAGAITLGSGVGAPAFRAPGPGDWTVEVRIRFPGDAGAASYAWRLAVR